MGAATEERAGVGIAVADRARRAGGATNQEIAGALACHPTTVGKRRNRFAELRLDGLHDEPRWRTGVVRPIRRPKPMDGASVQRTRGAQLRSGIPMAPLTQRTPRERASVPRVMARPWRVRRLAPPLTLVHRTCVTSGIDPERPPSSGRTPFGRLSTRRACSAVDERWPIAAGWDLLEDVGDGLIEGGFPRR